MGRGYRGKFICPIIILLILFQLCCLSEGRAGSRAAEDSNGSWELLMNNSGISAMHMALMRTDKVIMFDRTNLGPSNISLPGGRCRADPKDIALKNDCWAHSIEYDIARNRVRPLMIQTDTWCSAGGLDKDGRLIQTGGYSDGERVVRVFDACDGCDWVEFPDSLAVRRWYSTDIVLPDGRIIVVGGRKQFNYEFIPKRSKSESTIEFPFLQRTSDPSENNLYPFLHLLPDGLLYIFANQWSVAFNYRNATVLREYPPMPGGFSRNYPATGSSVLLPLDGNRGFQEVTVLICGGAKSNAYLQAKNSEFLPAAATCGRMKLTDPNPTWTMEQMPFPRVMGDMVMLPTGEVLIINGAQNGTAGWFLARNPAFHPVLYRPDLDPSNRFVTLNPSKIPRVYHSSCHLIPDGRILVGGSNPNVLYTFVGVLFPTELSLEAFSPPYLAPHLSSLRPTVTLWEADEMMYGSIFLLEFYVEDNMPVNQDYISVSLMAPTFTTHSFSMNQRLLRLQIVEFVVLPLSYQISVLVPPSRNLAPPGYYLLFVLYHGVPSIGKWVQLQG
ncbi:hypothetical protein SUGI_0261780 [Cryptomeria japonica]|uniref:aldehyde oxidase GLOX n=1 Tax=Cryptomeria japonica TaxID=3369 RepID=UPI002408BE82|nr:aldehyde oxidase GLOX [Cryptomeria japonica]GLJ15859.1 hypothetical protein SUGI_0261780 [Cryptomeria japonica]